ncbi:hypothetical protein GGS20DRAFT_205846 [Poronia punctata]|nr:hypothetical protein GGS20DRAFT_205846 [Poronia punctata]
MRFFDILSSCLATAAVVSAVPTPHTEKDNVVTDSVYDYVIVGSGAGGGPLACRLAVAGFRTLLIEAGGENNGNLNISVPGYQAAVTQDPTLRWDIFVNHYQDQNRAKRDPKYTYEYAPYQYHVGPNPPNGAREKGILYPRATGLGGCVSHNALIWITPHDSDWKTIATITGDDSWKPAKMNKYLKKVEKWLPTQPTDPTIVLGDRQLARHYVAGAEAAGKSIPVLSALVWLASLLLQSPNNKLNPSRDATQGYFQVPLTIKTGERMGVREYIQRTVAEGYPLEVRTNSFVTKINFDTTGNKPRATGIEYMEGEYLYRASPLSGRAPRSKSSVRAAKEVIISGGTFNTPQLLKLSGIGPANELRRFNIPVIKNLPGVGKNMMDRYEIPVNVKHSANFTLLDGCTFDMKEHDLCLKKWLEKPYIAGARGTYASNGLAAMMLRRSDFASTTDVDLSIFGGPINFQGYFPGWHDVSVRDHLHFSWYTLKAHTRNRAGTVELRSSDPLDTPLINFNYFDTGTTAGGADELDLGAIIQAIRRSRDALDAYKNYPIFGGSKFVEEKPGVEIQTDEELGQYIKDEAWGHHACCTAPIGPDADPMAVLDSEFRVRGVDGLRVVDASVFPDIPGIFIQSAIFMASEKAADAILAAQQASTRLV